MSKKTLAVYLAETEIPQVLPSLQVDLAVNAIPVDAFENLSGFDNKTAVFMLHPGRLFGVSVNAVDRYCLLWFAVPVVETVDPIGLLSAVQHTDCRTRIPSHTYAGRAGLAQILVC